MSDTPFFRRDGDLFVPQPVSRGPWDPKSLHGRVIAGLLGAEIERRFGDQTLQFSRLTVDLWRLPDFTPISVRLDARREGGRIRVVDAEAFAAGLSVGRATGVLLRKGDPAEGDVWRPDTWDFPPPDEVAAPPSPGEAPRDWVPMWEQRSTGMPLGGPAVRKRVWMREIHALIDSEPLTPFQRVALAADYTSPLANSGPMGLGYINTDITLYLYRNPCTEWIGFETADFGADAGVAAGSCRLYDERGPIGNTIVAALAQKRRPG
jgi:hypothetical protein